MNTYKITLGELVIEYSTDIDQNPTIEILQNERDKYKAEAEHLEKERKSIQSELIALKYVNEVINTPGCKSKPSEVHGGYERTVICEDNQPKTKKAKTVAKPEIKPEDKGLTAIQCIHPECCEWFIPSTKRNKYCPEHSSVKFQMMRYNAKKNAGNNKAEKPIEPKADISITRAMNKRGQFITDPMAEDHSVKEESPF